MAQANSSFGFGGNYCYAQNGTYFCSNDFQTNYSTSNAVWEIISDSPETYQDEVPVEFQLVENTREGPIFDAEDRRSIARETMGILDRRGYRFPDGHRVAIDSKVMQNSVRMFYGVTPLPISFPTFTTAIRILNADTATLLFKMSREGGSRPCGMILCNARNPGGGFLKGDAAQEEDLCLRSDLILGIDPKYNPRAIYPLPATGGICVNGVTLFRKGAVDNYALLRQDEVAKVDLIGIAAFDLRSGSPDRKALGLPSGEITGDMLRSNAQYMHGTKQKIHAWFTEAVAQNSLDVVPGALGCGSFCNPPEIIAQIFHAVLRESFIDRFRSVTFAIFSKDEQDRNLQVFQQAFQQ